MGFGPSNFQFGQGGNQQPNYQQQNYIPQRPQWNGGQQWGGNFGRAPSMQQPFSNPLQPAAQGPMHPPTMNPSMTQASPSGLAPPASILGSPTGSMPQGMTGDSAMNQPAVSAGAMPQSNPSQSPAPISTGSVLGGPPQSFARGGSFHAPVMRPSMDPQPKGLVASPVAGRTDRLPVSAKPHSYVIPADVVSGLGQGNTEAGGRILDAMLKQGPYGSAGAKPMGGHGVGIPRAPAMAKGLAAGGSTDEDGVPIIIAGGEYLCDPEIVAALGGGDPEQGHEILDQMVKSIRKQVIEQMKSLPGPVK